MATIYDLIEVTSLDPNTTYSSLNGNLLGIVDGASSVDLDDGEFDEGDSFFIGGTQYTIDVIQEPASTGTFMHGDGSTTSFGPGLESNLDVIYLTISNGPDVRYFILANDSYGDFNFMSVTTGGIQDVAGSDAAVIGETDNNINVVCFTQGTLIGVGRNRQTAVEDLRAGDLVRTLDHGLKPVLWIGARHLCTADMDKHPNLRPIRIAKGTLGEGTPDRDLVVSPQHRILVRSQIATRMFDAPEVLVPAKALLPLDGVDVAADMADVVYYHFLFDQHEVVIANGARVESLFTGEQALKTLQQEALAEILSLFPVLAQPGYLAEPARTFASGRRARTLVHRHIKNQRPLLHQTG